MNRQPEEGPLIGQTLSHDRVTVALGAGGVGELHRARDTRLGGEVALEILSAHLSPSPDLRRRLEREGKTVSSSNHPRICSRLEELRDGKKGSGPGMIRSHRATKAS